MLAETELLALVPVGPTRVVELAEMGNPELAVAVAFAVTGAE